jgi:nucleoside-diphosphate-sugar epimerase
LTQPSPHDTMSRDFKLNFGHDSSWSSLPEYTCFLHFSGRSRTGLFEAQALGRQSNERTARGKGLRDMSAYLVTGGAGFIGSHIVDYLVQRNERVRVLDDFSSGNIRNIQHNLDKIELITGSVADMPTVRASVEGIDFVMHYAAMASVPRSIEDPIGSNESGITGTLNLLVAARDCGVRRMVYASSSSVYGDAPESPKCETLPPSPISPYALTKLAGERYCRLFNEFYGFETVVLRFFNVFGPRQDPESEYAAVVPKFMNMLARGMRPYVYGDGTQSRDFTFVANVVAANILACHASEKVVGQVFNIACGESISILELIDTLNDVMGTSIAPKFGPARRGDVKRSVACIDKARELLGYMPEIGFREGLARMLG